MKTRVRQANAAGPNTNPFATGQQQTLTIDRWTYGAPAGLVAKAQGPAGNVVTLRTDEAMPTPITL